MIYLRLLAADTKNKTDNKDESVQTTTIPVETQGKEGWLRRLLPVRNIDPGHTSHSQQLSDKESVYELQSMFISS